MANILVLNGPNLNLLGSREPEIYGKENLSELIQMLQEQAQALGHNLSHLQSNAEHELIDAIHKARDDAVAAILFNPGAFTHTSIALRDAILAVEIPMIEVHLSNIFAREDFRQHSYLSGVAIGVISGFGTQGYSLALQAAHHHINKV